MYMKNTVSNEMRMKRTPTHIHPNPNQVTTAQSNKRGTASAAIRTPNVGRGTPHQVKTTTSGQAGDISDATLPSASARVGNTAAGGFTEQAHAQTQRRNMGSGRQMTESLSGGLEKYQKGHGNNLKEKQRGLSASMSKQELTSPSILQIQGHYQMPQNDSRAEALKQRNSESSEKRRAYKNKQYQTSFSKSDRKESQSFGDELSSPIQLYSARRPHQNDNKSVDPFGINSSETRTLMPHKSATTLRNQEQGSLRISNFQHHVTPGSSSARAAALVLAGASQDKQNTSPRLPGSFKGANMVIRKSTPDEVKPEDSLVGQFQKLQMKAAQQSSKAAISKDSRSPHGRTSQQQKQLKMEELMTTPKRTADPAFKRGNNALSSSTRHQTQSRLNHHHAGIADVPPSRTQTEEGGDGAQAIENESDNTDEADASCPPSIDPVHLQPPLQGGGMHAVSEALERHIIRSNQVSGLGAAQPLPQFHHDNSSFGQRAELLPGHKMPSNESDEDSEAIVVMNKSASKKNQDAINNNSNIEEARRGRSCRNTSFNKLFSKSAGNTIEDSTGVDQFHMQSSHGNHQPSGYRNLNDQYEERKHPQRIHEEEQCSTDEEIFDQDGGQDRRATSLNHGEEASDGESGLVRTNTDGSGNSFTPAQHMQSAMASLRKNQPLQQPLSAYCTWAQQEPHIDEEMSDAEEDNSDEAESPQIHQYVTHVNLDLQSNDDDSHSEALIKMNHLGDTSPNQAKNGVSGIDYNDTPLQVNRKQGSSNVKQSERSKKDQNRSKFVNGKEGKNVGISKQGGFQTPLELASTSAQLPPKTNVTSIKKRQYNPNRSRMKPSIHGQLKSHKLSSIDLSEPALSPKRGLFLEGNSNSEISQSLAVTKSHANEPSSRATPRQQPITNFQLQQEQAKLIRSKQSYQAQKMNQTAFGTSQSIQKAHQSKHDNQGNISQSYNTFLNDKNCQKQLNSKDLQQNRQSKPLISSCNLINYQNLVTQNSTAPVKSKLTKQGNASVRDGLKGSGSSKKQTSSGKNANSTAQQKHLNSSIFVTAKQQTSSLANCKQVLHQNVGSGIKPFTMDGHDVESGKQSTISSASPEKRFQSRQNAQIAALQMGTQQSSVKTSKTLKERDGKTRANQSTLMGSGSTSSAILHNHLRQLHTHHLSHASLHSVQQLKDASSLTAVRGTESTKHQNLNQWSSVTSKPAQQPQHKTLIGAQASYTKQTVSSSKNAQVNAISEPPKTATHVKESPAMSTGNGFQSHTAARATQKRGFFRENGGTAIPSSHLMSAQTSLAQLPFDEDSALTMDSVKRSSSKGKKKPANKTTTANSSLKGKRASATQATEPSYANSKASAKYMDSQAQVRPPSSNKIREQQKVQLNNYNSSQPQIFQGSTRQRTNTTMGLQSHKNHSMRQSMNNLTLNELMAKPTTVSSTVNKATKQPSGRGATTGKTSTAISQSQSFINVGVPNFKSSQMKKPQSTNQTRKQTNASQIQSSSMTSHVNERVELLTGKGASQGLNKKVLLGSQATSQVQAGSRTQKRASETTGGKLRSQSTLKQHAPSGLGQNSNLLNFTSTAGEQPQRKSNNPQHSIIIAAVETKTQLQKSVRESTTRNTHENKRASVNQTKEWGLADFEKAQYGDRCPKGYEKLSLLGKGGCAVVWLAREQKTGRNVALKQFPKPKNAAGQVSQLGGTLDPTAKIEIEMGRLLFAENSIYNGYSINPKEFPGIQKIARLYSVIEESRDVWLAYQVGGKCLTNHLFDVKGEFYKGERLYGVQHQDFYRALKDDKQVLIDLIRMLAEVFDVLAMFRIVHADIKPDNILIDFDGRRIRDVKLIDFGSAFSYENPSSISATTPEYLAPEVLEYLERRGQNTDASGNNSTNLCRQQEPWSYDMWSMGAILLELLTGIPLWLSLKCRAHTQTGKQMFGTGIFGVQGRQGKKILQKQSTGLKNLPQTLKKYECYGLDKDPVFMDLLTKMLDPNPINRISPIEVLEHPFIKQKHGSALASKN